ncbi:hypothetical protein JXI42_14480, partial [bacterium]|nr:hypothetical protein [bacterium]
MGKKVTFVFFLLILTICDLKAGWDLVELGPPWNPGVLEFFNEDTGFAGELRTTDGGLAWEDDWIIPPFGRVWSIQMVSAREGWLLFQPIGITRPRHHLAITTDCGDSWTHVYDCDTDFPYITQIRSLQFTDINHGWIQGESGDTAYYFKTDDGGESWYNIYIDPYEYCFELYFSDSLNGYGIWTYYPDRFIFYRTTDGGSIWDSVSTVLVPFESSVNGIWCRDFTDLWLCAGDYGYTYDCREIGPRLLLHSSDSAATFDTLLFDDYAEPLLKIAFYDSFGVLSDWRGNLFYSDDYGASWVCRPFEYYTNILWLGFKNADEIWATDGFTLFKTTNRGITWERYNRTAHIDWRSLACNTCGEIGAGCSNTGLGFLKFSSDAGDSWFEDYPEVGDVWICKILDIEMPDSNNWYVIVETGNCRSLYKTINAGLDWYMIFNERISGLPILYLCDIEVTTQSIWLTEGREGEFFRSGDGGMTWDTLTSPYEVYKTFSCNSNHLWAEKANADVFWHSTNGGETWILQSIGEDTLYGSFRVEDVYFLDSLYAWCLSQAGSIYVTANGGDDWEFISETPPFCFSSYTSIIFVNRMHGFIAGKGLFETTDCGLTWMEIPGFSGYTFLDMDFADSATGYAAGWQGVIARYSSSEWIEETDGALYPRILSLTIYPNPFNKSTTIVVDFGSLYESKLHSSCRIEAPTNADIEIFDINGRQIDWRKEGKGENEMNPHPHFYSYTHLHSFSWHPN